MQNVMSVEVADIRKSVTSQSNIKAVADIKLGGSLLVKGVCVVQGKNGMFVSLPRKSRDGQWLDVLEPDKNLRKVIDSEVMRSFERETDGVK